MLMRHRQLTRKPRKLFIPGPETDFRDQAYRSKQVHIEIPYPLAHQAAELNQCQYLFVVGSWYTRQSSHVVEQLLPVA